MAELIAVASAREAHGRRVEAIACELARQLGLGAADLHQLRTALRHRHPHCGPCGARASEFSNAPHPKTLQGYTVPDLLLIAQVIDMNIEFEPFASLDGPQIESSLTRSGLSVIRRTNPEALREVAKRLPVFPAVALRAVQVLTRHDLELSELEQLALSDPVLAGSIVSHANSALYYSRQRIRSVPRAITHIGTSAARRVMLAALLRPVYDSPCMRPLWRHALESADTAAYLALRTQFLSAPEAALAGLVHDIGALAISLLDRGATSACNRLRAAGCPPTVAEWIVCGFDHAEAGAVVLETWGFPTDLVQAVRHHHAPEKSDTALAAMLYLVEFWTCGDEDLPSAVRLDLAAQRLDLSRQAVYALRPAKLLSRCDALTS